MSINLNETLKNNVLIVEFFLGKIKYIKNKTFSGPLRKISLDISESSNLTNEQLIRLKNLIVHDDDAQISKNKYALDQGQFYKVLEFIKENGLLNLYCISKDKKHHLVEDIILSNANSRRIMEQLENYTFSKTNEYVYVKLVSSEIVYRENKLFYRLNKIAPVEAFHRGIKREIAVDKVKAIELSKIQPNPHAYIYKEENKYLLNLFFDYNGIEIPSNSKIEFIRDDNEQYFRDINKEDKKIRILEECGWKRAKMNIFSRDNIWSIQVSVDKLIENGFTVFWENEKPVLHSSNIQYSISYNINWFELESTINIGDNSYNLADSIDLKKRKRQYIEVDDKVIFLPEILNKNKLTLSNQQDKFIISKHNIRQLFDLSEELNIEKIDGYEKFIAYDSIDIDVPAYLINLLRDYQIDGVKWLKYLYKNSFGGCLGDDMGLGKTLQVISFLSEQEIMSNSLINLVVVPKSLLFNWEREIRRFSPEMKVIMYHGDNRNSIIKNIQRNCTVLTTYGTILNDIEKIRGLNINCLILDEVQYIKNSVSKTYKAISKLSARIKIGLSGTPFENNVTELWALMNVLNPGLFGSKKDFIKKYSDINDNKKALIQLKKMIKPFILRRKKLEVLPNLPEKFEQEIYCDMTHQQKELYDSILTKIRNEINRLPTRYEIKDNALILEGLLYLRQICCHPKLLRKELNINNCYESEKFELFKIKMEEIMNNKGKVVVFSQFTSMLKIMEKWIKQKKWNYFYLDGTVKNRQKIVEGFEKSNEGIFLISLKAGGVGLNLVSSQYAIIYDPWWNPAVEDQAADRIYRIGQTENVFIYRFITVDSIEEKIQELKKVKNLISLSILDDLDKPKSITIEDLKHILTD